jgi:PncC family amidohydrolase
MALGVAARAGADLAVSVTGIAGPEGGTSDQPVGTVYFGVACTNGVHAYRRDFFGDRSGIRERATVTAIDLLRRALLGR